MTTLRQIEEDMQALEDLLMDVGGDVTAEEADAAITAWLEENAKNLKQKLDGYGTVIKLRTALSKMRDEEAERLHGLAMQDAATVKRLKERLLDFMTRNPSLGKSIETTLHKFSVAGNGGVQGVELNSPYTAEEALKLNPKMKPFIRVRYEWDMEAIREELELGVYLGFAKLKDRGKHLRVK